MPTIPIYESKARLPGRFGGVTVRPNQAIARGLSQVAQGLDSAAHAQLALEQQERRGKYIKAQTEYLTAISDFELGAAERKGEGAKGILQDFQAFEAETRSRIAGQHDERVQRAFNQWVELRHQEHRGKWAKYEHGQLRAAEKDNISANIALHTGRALTEPRALPDILADVDDAYATLQINGHLSAEERQAQQQATVLSIRQGAASAAYAQDPERTAAELEAGGWGVDPITKARLLDKERIRLDRIRVEKERAAREEERVRLRKGREVLARLPDVTASIQALGDDGGVDVVGDLLALGLVEEAEAARQSVDLAWKLYGTAHAAGTSLMAQAEALEAEFPVQAGSEGAAEIIRAREEARRMVAGKVKAFGADPAGYVAARVAEGLPENAPDIYRVRTSVELQRDVAAGIPGFRPRVFSGAQAAAIREEFERADADGRLQTLMDLSRLGEFEEQALGELGIDGAAMLARDVLQANSAMVGEARVLVEGFASDAKPVLPAEDLKEIKEDFQDELEGSDAWQALAEYARLQPQNSALRSRMAAMRKGLEAAALRYGDAEKAVEVLDKTYASGGGDDVLGYWRRDRLSMDPDDVAARLRAYRTPERLREFLESHRGAFESPELFEEFVQDVAEGGVWTPEGESFVLVDPTSGLVLTGADGEPMRLQFGEVPNLPEPESPYDFNFLGEMGDTF